MAEIRSFHVALLEFRPAFRGREMRKHIENPPVPRTFVELEHMEFFRLPSLFYAHDFKPDAEEPFKEKSRRSRWTGFCIDR